MKPDIMQCCLIMLSVIVISFNILAFYSCIVLVRIGLWLMHYICMNQIIFYAEVSGRGRENGNETPRKSNTTAIKMPLTSVSSNDGAASTFGLASQRASGVLSGSGVLNARPESAASSGLLSHMVSTTNADVSKEYLEKVAELLLEFSQADSIVKSYMCNPSLLTRLFHMFNRVEPPTLLKVGVSTIILLCEYCSSTVTIMFSPFCSSFLDLAICDWIPDERFTVFSCFFLLMQLLKCINNLSIDPNCLENFKRVEEIKNFI